MSAELAGRVAEAGLADALFGVQAGEMLLHRGGGGKVSVVEVAAVGPW